MGGRGGGRGRGGRGRGRGAGINSNGGPNQPQPVEFHLYASPQFDMKDCPALVRPPTVADALLRLTMPDREILGDIVLWFAAAAVAEPSARLVMWQATKQDKAWLSGYVESSVPALEVSVVEAGPSNKFMQFKLQEGLVPTPPAPKPQQADSAVPPPPAAPAASAEQADESAAAAAAAAASAAAPAAVAPTAAAASSEPPAAAVESAKPSAAQEGKEPPAPAASASVPRDKIHKVAEAVRNAAEDAGAKLAAAGHRIGEAATAAAGGHKATATAAPAPAAAPTQETSTEGHHQMNGSAAVDKAAYSGQQGSRAQLAVWGGTVAAALVGVTVALVFGRRRKH